MNEYICYTPEGWVVSPTDEEVDSHVVLGFAKGETENEAIRNLLKENPWIVEKGFATDVIEARQLA